MQHATHSHMHTYVSLLVSGGRKRRGFRSCQWYSRGWHRGGKSPCIPLLYFFKKISQVHKWRKRCKCFVGIQLWANLEDEEELAGFCLCSVPSPQGQRRRRRRRRKQKEPRRKRRRHRLFSLFQVLFWGRSLSSFGGKQMCLLIQAAAIPSWDKMSKNLCLFSAAAVVYGQLGQQQVSEIGFFLGGKHKCAC